ncbi:restriction endonuclease subunit S [Priestia megaterium]
MVETTNPKANSFHKKKYGDPPVEWSIKKLKDVLTVGYGKNQKEVEVEDSKIPILGTGGIIGWAKKSLFDRPSVLIGRKGTIDKPRYIETPFWTIDTLFYTDIKEDLACPKYIYYLFQTINWYRYNEATGVPSLSASNISNIDFLCPPLKEQQKIVEILSTLDEKIENTERIIEKMKKLKKGLMQQLLTKGINHTKFKQTELGEIPVEWEIKRISDLTTVKTGGTPSKSKPEYWQNGEIRWMSSGEVKLKRVYEVKERISELGYQHSNTTLLPINTIMMAMNGQGKTRGTVALLHVETTCNQSLAGILPSDLYNSEFLFYYLESQYDELRSITGEGRSGLNLSLINSFPVLFPPLKEQQKIAEILSSIDEKTEVYEQEKEKYIELKKGLMQQLLTGKLRVTV